MSVLSSVQEAVAEVTRVREQGDGVVAVTTHCMYPTNSFVQVHVSGGENSFIVSDGGAAFHEIESAGVSNRLTDGMVKHLLVDQGLIVENGVIRAPFVSRAALPIAVMLVANASKEAADWFYTHLKIKRKRDFKRLVREYLRNTFDANVKHDEQIVGKSNKTHKFENVISLPRGKRLIVDPVLYEHASISSRIVANLDVRNMDYQNLEQRIVYDDQGDEEWKPEDLNLLAVGATVIPFSKSADVIQRLAGSRG